jgi:hypothetical protein
MPSKLLVNAERVFVSAPGLSQPLFVLSAITMQTHQQKHK